MVEITVKTLFLETSEAWKEEGGVFKFWAKSISTNEICEPMMDLLVDQAFNEPLIFRHRHPAGRDDKVVPMFGRMKAASKIKENDKIFLLAEYHVPVITKYGHEIKHTRIFADWVKESYKGKKPIAISLSYIQYKEDGKAFWVEFLEASGTHVPACTDCLHVKGESIVIETAEEQQKKKFQDLEDLLEKMTLEKKGLEGKVTGLETEKSALKASLETQNTKLMADVARLSTDFAIIAKELDFAKTKGPLVKRVLELEKRPELEMFYREQKPEYLEAKIKEFEAPRPATSLSKNDILAKITAAAKESLEVDQEPTVDEVLKNVDPSIRDSMREFLKKGG